MKLKFSASSDST